MKNRFTLISFATLLFAIPFLVVVYQSVNELDQQISFTEAEQHGIEYHHALLTLMTQIQEYRGMLASTKEGEPSFADAIISKREDITKTIRQIDKINHRTGTLLQTEDGWRALKKSWSTVEKHILAQSAAESFDSLSNTISSIQTFMLYIADTSNLITDPELTSYYLMDIAVNRIPDMVELLGITRGQVASLLAQHHNAETEQTALSLLGKLEWQYSRFERSLNTIEARDKKISLLLSSIHQESTQLKNQFVKVVSDIVIHHRHDVAPASVFSGWKQQYPGLYYYVS